VSEGTTAFKGEDVTEDDPDERSLAGLFMAFQYPVAIPGVSVSKYLRMILNAHREARGEGEIKIKDFAKVPQEALDLAGTDRHVRVADPHPLVARHHPLLREDHGSQAVVVGGLRALVRHLDELLAAEHPRGADPVLIRER